MYKYIYIHTQYICRVYNWYERKDRLFYVPVQIYRSVSIPIYSVSWRCHHFNVVVSQVVKEATEAFLFIGAGDAWRALGQQRLSDLSETSGTPGPERDWQRNKATPTDTTEGNAFDFWACWAPEKGNFLEHAGMWDVLRYVVRGWQEPSVLQSMRTCRPWLFGEIFGTMGVCSLRGGVSRHVHISR